MMAKNGNDAARAAWNKTLANNYGTPSISLVSGKGAVVKDVDGNSYIDFLGGIATNVLGHAHPSVVAAVRKQIGILSHVSNFYSHPQMLQLAGKLQALTGDSQAKVFFCNSGAEANEAALKLSRKTGRSGVVAMKGAFHGRTMGALSLTGQPSKRDPFKPLIKGITHVPYNDIAALRRKVSKRTAMVIVEPMMGEQGVVTPDPGYLKAIREICTNAGALMVIDCVQTGMGRTGEWFGYEAEGIRPDVITLAKGLGGGLPLGAMIALGSVSELFAPGDHGSTFGGNSVSCAAANAAIAAIEREKLLPAAKKKFSLIKKG
jgi:acetylornithine aminotransferase